MQYEQFNFEEKVLYHENHIQRYLDGTRPVPLNIEIDLTNACNHRCSFCVWGDYIQTTRATLPFEVVIQCLNDLKLLGTKSINWTGGGEPTLHKEFYKLLNYSSKLGLENGLITNASLIREEYDEQLLDQLVWLRASMAGGNAEHYRKIQGADDFEKVLSNLKRLSMKRTSRHSKISLGIAMLVTRDNLSSVMSLVDRSIDLGIDYLQLREDMFMLESDKLWWNEEARLVIEEAENRVQSTMLKILGATYQKAQRHLEYPQKCHAHHFVLGINAEGYVAFCKNTRDNPDFYIGNLKEQSFSEIWETSLKNRELEASINPIKCATFCKNMGINAAIERVSQKSADLPEKMDPIPVHPNFL